MIKKGQRLKATKVLRFLLEIYKYKKRDEFLKLIPFWFLS